MNDAQLTDAVGRLALEQQVAPLAHTAWPLMAVIDIDPLQRVRREREQQLFAIKAAYFRATHAAHYQDVLDQLTTWQQNNQPILAESRVMRDQWYTLKAATLWHTAVANGGYPAGHPNDVISIEMHHYMSTLIQIAHHTHPNDSDLLAGEALRAGSPLLIGLRSIWSHQSASVRLQYQGYTVVGDVWLTMREILLHQPSEAARQRVAATLQAALDILKQAREDRRWHDPNAVNAFRVLHALAEATPPPKGTSA